MENSALEKLSPLKPLTADQAQLVQEIITFTTQHLQAGEIPAITPSTEMLGRVKVSSYPTYSNKSNWRPAWILGRPYMEPRMSFWLITPKS